MIRGQNEDGCDAVHWVWQSLVETTPETLCGGLPLEHARRSPDIYEVTCKACVYFYNYSGARSNLLTRRRTRRAETEAPP